MPDLPATSRKHSSSLQRWHSSKNASGCMTALSQMLHLGKFLGGSTSYLPTSGAKDQNSRSRTQSAAAGTWNSAMMERMQEAEVVIDLRGFLKAKQEPFVLQDVIWEKRHPVRTQSSRELKFDLNNVVSSPGKSQSSRKISFKEKRRPSDAALEGATVQSPQEIERVSPVLVKSTDVAIDSSVALPPGQASIHRKKSRPSSPKMPMTGKSHVRSPNKKALLMEAASRILEGSQRHTFRKPSSIARSLLRELVESKETPDMLIPEEALTNEVLRAVGSAGKGKSLSQGVNTLDGNNSQSKPSIHIDANDCLSFLNQPNQKSPSSLNGSLEDTDGDIVLMVQTRIQPLDVMPAGSDQLMQPAIVADNSLQLYCGKEPDEQVSTMTEMGHEKRKIWTDASACATHCHVDLRHSDEAEHRGAESVMVSEAMGRHHEQCEKSASANTNRDLELGMFKDQSQSQVVKIMTVQKTVHSLETQEHLPRQIPNFFNEAARPEKDLDVASNVERVEAGIESTSDEGFPGLDSNRLIVSSTGIGGECVRFTESRPGIAGVVENVGSPILLLCNYSWWTQDKVEMQLATHEEEVSYNCIGYDSPTACANSHSVNRTFEEGNEVENDEADSSTSADHSYVDEFQQSSPVSVLDAVYDENISLVKPFDYFDEARQKLLESVRRYETLMHMDLDTLIKLNEENIHEKFDEESVSPSFKESGLDDSSERGADEHAMATMRNKESLQEFDDDYNLYTHADDDLYIEVLAERHGTAEFDPEVNDKARLAAASEVRQRKSSLECSIEPSDSRVSDGLHCPRRRRSSIFRDDWDEEEEQACLIFLKAILQMDITTSSRWTGFREEVEGVEMELETCLYGELMHELVSELGAASSSPKQVSSPSSRHMLCQAVAN